MTPAENTERARVAALRRHHPQAPETNDAAAAFKANRLAQYIECIVNDAPPLSPEQRHRLALLLRPAGEVR